MAPVLFFPGDVNNTVPAMVIYCGVMVRRPGPAGPGGPALPHWVLTGTMWPAPVDAHVADEACRQWRALDYDTRLEVLQLGRHMTFRTLPLRWLLRRWHRRWRAGLLRYLRRRERGLTTLPQASRLPALPVVRLSRSSLEHQR